MIDDVCQFGFNWDRDGSDKGGRLALLHKNVGELSEVRDASVTINVTDGGDSYSVQDKRLESRRT